MNEKYILGKNIDIIPIDISRVDEAMEFQDKIIDKMDNKKLFTPLTREEFIAPIVGCDNVYFLKYKDELIGLVVATCDMPEVLQDYHLPNDNVMLVDSIMVKQEYRGHGLQKQVLDLLEKRARRLGLDGLVATVHPDNIYSLRNFLDMNYRILHTAFLHGGERFVLVKQVFTGRF